LRDVLWLHMGMAYSTAGGGDGTAISPSVSDWTHTTRAEVGGCLVVVVVCLFVCVRG
jgi:hypothetical protein